MRHGWLCVNVTSAKAYALGYTAHRGMPMLTAMNEMTLEFHDDEC